MARAVFLLYPARVAAFVADLIRAGDTYPLGR